MTLMPIITVIHNSDNTLDLQVQLAAGPAVAGEDLADYYLNYIYIYIYMCIHTHVYIHRYSDNDNNSILSVSLKHVLLCDLLFLISMYYVLLLASIAISVKFSCFIKPWGNTNGVVSNRVASKGPLYPSKTKTIICFVV